MKKPEKIKIFKVHFETKIKSFRECILIIRSKLSESSA